MVLKKAECVFCGLSFCASLLLLYLLQHLSLSSHHRVLFSYPRDPLLSSLEHNAPSVIGADWVSRLDKVFVDNLGKFRKYDGRSVQDLLRALRNKKHHYQDLPEGVRRAVGAMPAGYLAYFTRRWPGLFLHVYGVVKGSGLRGESMFRAYFSLPDAP